MSDYNYRDELFRGSGRRKPPPYIVMAQDDIDRNLGDPIGPEDIAVAVHVSTRTLHAGFEANLTTPLPCGI